MVTISMLVRAQNQQLVIAPDSGNLQQDDLCAKADQYFDSIDDEEQPIEQRQLMRVQTDRQGVEIDVPLVKQSSPCKHNIFLDVDAKNDIQYNNKTCFLGEGSFGRVYMGVWKGQTVAVKVFKEEYQSCLGQECTSIFEREFDIMARMQHENIVDCYGGNKALGKRAILMEYMDRGSLDVYIHKNSSPIKLINYFKILKSICKALAYLHPTIVHRDIKPQNVLLNKKGYVKVADFGLSRFKEATTTLFSSNPVGTPHYVAPEVLTGKFKITSQVDVYSLGILMWEMYTRKRPWHGNKDYQIAYLVMTDERPELPKECPANLCQMIRRCWAPNPNDRPTSQEVYLWCKDQIQMESKRAQPILLYKPT
eukprot:TRINITY_DN811_c0_g2_i4.p1 TRINITY_DN811_c0_g2~~TRINITY_DN811_c0_g2_i4.p1  ORF type:complete len:366 (-),score=17.40 TRINITY_DN811_c0_g2_i4:691-1788(-)